MKTVIVYEWQSNSEPSLEKAMKALGINVVSFNKPIKDYHADAVFAQEFIALLHTVKADAVFSFDYFPILSSVCEINKIPYLSWIYDCPMYTLLSQTLRNACNYIFCFDEIYTRRLQQLGAVNCFHFPLGVAAEDFEQTILNADAGQKERFTGQVSFVGNFYNGEKNRLRNAAFDEYTAGYLTGIIDSQQKVCGCNFVAEALSEESVQIISQACRLQMGPLYITDERQLAADAVNMEITARDREDIIARAACFEKVDVYTGSELPESLCDNANIRNQGYADNAGEMPLIFYGSKINLNISSRSIESGIPQRVLDILACGGFCLTNYQPEIEGFFQDGEELVMYTDAEDFAGKLSYYLEHEEERKQIAQNGKSAVLQKFSLKNRVSEMLSLVKNNIP